jgi:hypothetical protein
MKLVDLDKLLPSDIPQGETILWYGQSDWVSLARNAYRVDWVAFYFLGLMIWNAVTIAYESDLWDALQAIVSKMGLGLLALSLLCLLAWLSAHTTLYVITTRRIVMKIGIALPIFFNLPFSQIESAALRLFSDGTGDLPFTLAKGRRIAYLHLWPHARPLHFANPQPALRCIPQAQLIADVLKKAMVEEAALRLGAGAVVHHSAQNIQAYPDYRPSSAMTMG